MVSQLPLIWCKGGRAVHHGAEGHRRPVRARRLQRAGGRRVRSGVRAAVGEGARVYAADPGGHRAIVLRVRGNIIGHARNNM